VHEHDAQGDGASGNDNCRDRVDPPQAETEIECGPAQHHEREQRTQTGDPAVNYTFELLLSLGLGAIIGLERRLR